MNIRRSCLAAIAVWALGSCAVDAAEKQDGKKPMAMKITSSAFQEGQPIPAKYTCDGENISLPLKWSDAPAGTKFFALICDDPDAPVGTWVHWVVYGLPATTTELAEKIPASESLENGAKQGVNDFKHVGYGGPCPPSEKPHRYYFKIYALDAEIPLKPRATKKELLKAMEGQILAQGELMGTYQRKR
jgi:Raf kinase inhibitor-like YbhB/YbcL family protein